MLTVQIDEGEVRGMVRERIAQMVKEVDAEMVFWDSDELKKRVCMSWNTIQSAFFFDPRFPKRKVGGKWMYPARETRAFLELWLDEQPKN